ncbi:Transportin-1, partial [Physocladia obscura]
MDGYLQQLVAALSKTTSPDTLVQQQVQQFLTGLSQSDAASYIQGLGVIFGMSAKTQGLVVDDEARRVAGLLLKNVVSVRDQYLSLAHTPNAVVNIKQAAFDGLGDSNAPTIQKTAGLILTSLVRVDVEHAPSVVARLVQLVESQDLRVAEAAFLAISIICEDSAQTLDRDANSLLQQLIPFFISKFDHPTSARIRALAIQSTNQFAIIHSPVIIVNLIQYVQALYRRATDEDSLIIKNVCQGLVLVLEIKPEALAAEMQALISFMLKCTESPDSLVALEACEFWLTFAEQDTLMDYLEPYLNELVRVLLKGMIYSENELMNLGPDIEDSHIADRAEDIKPVFHKAKNHASKLTDEQKRQLKEQQKAAGNGDDTDSDDDDYDDDDDDDADSEWTLRKCSAAALDVMSNIYLDGILEALLPRLKEFLGSEDWRYREAGILALGAIAEGCSTGIEPHLRDLVKFLTQCLADPKPLVRSITCWTLSRYSRWIVNGPELSQAEPNHSELYFHPFLHGLLIMILDNSKRVQEAGCSALATLEEEALDLLIPFIPHILDTLSKAFKKYQHKNLLILYDAVGTLADSVGNALNNPAYIPLLLAPLVEKWKTINDEDREIFPLLECMSSVAISLGSGFKEMAPPVWERCLRIVQSTLQKQAQYNQAVAQHAPEAVEEPDMDFVIVALDLLSGVVQGLGEDARFLAANSQPPIMDVVEFCMKDTSPDVRQSAYALLGDLIISTFQIVRPHLDTLFPIIIHQIGRKDETHEMSVCNNATWATGELALQLGAEARPFIQPLLPVLVAILNAGADRRLRTLQENAAITVGRFGLVCPADMAPALEHFVLGWCSALRDVRDNLEKETAYKGMCAMVQANPEGMLKYIAYFCDAVTRWEKPSLSMNEVFTNTLVGYRNGLGSQWDQLVASFPAQTREKL